METAHSAFETASLGSLLARDHARLDALFAELIAACRAGAREDTARLWSAFESGLVRHMDLEERLLFPSLAESHPIEAKALWSEHVDIQRKLLELGIGMDLHVTRSEVVEAFVDSLRAHAAREERFAYRWADTRADPEIRAELEKRLLETKRRQRF